MIIIGIVSAKSYDNWDDFNFEIVNVALLDGNFHCFFSYGVYVLAFFFILREYGLMLEFSTAEINVLLLSY